MSGEMGEVELKVNELVEEVFGRYNPSSINNVEALLDKEQIR
jgi:hypothetical protein